MALIHKRPEPLPSQCGAATEKSNKSIPLQSDEPDGWPRTADGYLVRPGMTVHAGEGELLVNAVYKDGVINGHGAQKGFPYVFRLEEAYAVKPEPITMESALRNLVAAFSRNDESLREALVVAKEALANERT